MASEVPTSMLLDGTSTVARQSPYENKADEVASLSSLRLSCLPHRNSITRVVPAGLPFRLSAFRLKRLVAPHQQQPLFCSKPRLKPGGSTNLHLISSISSLPGQLPEVTCPATPFSSKASADLTRNPEVGQNPTIACLGITHSHPTSSTYSLPISPIFKLLSSPTKASSHVCASHPAGGHHCANLQTVLCQRPH